MSARRLLFVALSGALFGFGLAVSTMVKPEVILSFLLWRDMGLLLVLCGGVAVTFIAYQLVPRVMKRPFVGDRFDVHAAKMAVPTIAGAAIFGVGWGLSGVCPGPAIAGPGVGNWPLLVSLAGLLAGAYVQGRYFAK